MDLTSLFAFITFSTTGLGISVINCQNDFSCPAGYFSCNDSLACVEQRQNCDGNKQCADGSDEWNCVNEHDFHYWNRLFKKRPDEDSEKVKGECDLTSPPESCACVDKRIMCGYRKLTAIPKNLPGDTSDIDLSTNYIKQLTPGSFQDVPSLKTLLLTNNFIENIENGTFTSLKYLQKLYLGGNQIVIIVENVFESNVNLHTLDISHNGLRTLPRNSLRGLVGLRDLDLRRNRLHSLSKGVFQGLINLRVVDLRENVLTKIVPGIFNDLPNLISLHLSGNSIQIIQSFSFSGMEALEGLFLAWNKLEALHLGVFDNLTRLLNLDLSENKLAHFDSGIFAPLKKLESLNFRKNSFRRLARDLLEDLTQLEHIYFDEFSLCASALHVRVCEPKGDGISSLENLLDNLVLRITVWIVAIVACLGNAFVFISRLFIKENNEVHSFYIKNLSLADFFMGVYLFIIASYDVYFRGEYIQSDQQWRLSWQCNFCGILSTLSSEASVFTLTVITFDRYFSISRPLSLQRRTKRFAFICTAILWLLASVLSILPVSSISYYGDEFYGNNGVCLPLHIHNPFAQAWEYSAVMFIGVNFVAFVFIFYAYIKMFLIIKNSTISLRSTQEKQDRTIAKRFAFIVGTDFLCWMPIIVIKILVLCGISIKDDFYAWLAVFVLPVNSALNPILYTLTTKLFKQQVCHCSFPWKWQTSVGSRHQESSGLSLSYVFFHRASWSKRNNPSNNTNSTLRSSIKSCSSRDSMRICRVLGADQQHVTQV